MELKIIQLKYEILNLKEVDNIYILEHPKEKWKSSFQQEGICATNWSSQEV